MCFFRRPSQLERDCFSLVGLFDAMDENFVGVCDEEGITVGTPQQQRAGRKRPQNRTRMAHALAHEAYMEFGHREKSAANAIITRKWMRDHIGQFKDLRAVDAAMVIDEAMPYSFLPSRALRYMNVLQTTDAWIDREDTQARRPWWPFGRRVWR